MGMVSPSVICSPREIDLLITDDGIADDTIAAFEAAGVRVMTV
jgi:DeoR/GlpR family transcriptional regulator of sugar metabolism